MRGERVNPLLVAAIAVAAALCAAASEAARAGGAESDGPAPPSISRIVIDRDGSSAFEGRGSPGSQVAIHSDGRMIAAAIVGDTGTWSVAIGQAATIGDHTYSSVAAGRDEPIHGDEVRISVPEALAGPAVITYEETHQPISGNIADESDPLRKRAEELAAAASGRFSELMRGPRNGVEVAEAQAKKAPDGEAPTPSHAGAGVVSAVADWLEHAANAYQSQIIDKLSTPGREAVSPPQDQKGEDRKTPADQSPGLAGRLAAGARAAWGVVQDWFDRAGHYFRTENAEDRSQPPNGTAGREAAPPAAERDRRPEHAVAAPGDKVAQNDKPPPSQADIAKEMQENEKRFREGLRKLEDARKAGADGQNSSDAKREAEAAEERRKEEAALKERQEKRKAEIAKRRENYERRIVEGLKRLEEAQKAEQAHKAAQEKRRLEEERVKEEKAREAVQSQRLAEEAKLNKAAEEKRLEGERAKAEEARKAAESQRLADEAKRNDAEAKRVEEERLKAEEARQAAESQRLAEEAKRQAAEAKRLEGERAKNEEARQAAESQRLAEEAKRKDAEAKRVEEERATAEKAASASRQLALSQRSSEAGPQSEQGQPEEKAPTGKPPLQADAGQLRQEKAVEEEGGSRASGASEPRPRVASMSDDTQRVRVRKSGMSKSKGRRHLTALRGRKHLVYVVQRGDTLWAIANRYLRSGTRYEIIYRANRQIKDPDFIYPRQRLIVPIR
jgi:nucleoid-associated protein YgaU